MIKAQIDFLIQFILNQVITLENIKAKIAGIRPISEDRTNSLAFYIHNYYSCVEDILKEIEKVFENSGHYSPDYYHKNLLLHATYEIKLVRPKIISKKTYDFLYEILRFRHLFRHAYNYTLIPQKVKENKILVINNHSQLIIELKEFIAFLENIEIN